MTPRETPTGFTQRYLSLYQRRGSLDLPRVVGDEQEGAGGGVSGAFLACLREQLAEMPHSMSWGQGGLVSGRFSRKHAQWGIGGEINGVQPLRRPEEKGVGLGPEVLKMAGVRIKRAPSGCPQRGKAVAGAPDSSRVGMRELWPGSFSIILLSVSPVDQSQ